MALKDHRRTTRIAWALLALLLAASAIDGVRLWRQQRWNDRIVSGTLPADAARLPVQARFARAYLQETQGMHEAALQRYRALHGDPAVGQAARYNTANLLMREAAVLRAGPEPAKAIALIELAKQFYRDVLRIDPQQWDARYNLERAQRLLPDPEESETEPMPAPEQAERAATTMRGYSPGLP